MKREDIPLIREQIQHLACLRWICSFKILDFVPQQGAIPYDSLAQLAKVPEHSLKNVVRMLMCSDFLSERVPGMVSHSRSSLKYATSPALQDYVLYLADVRIPAAISFTEATRKWNQTASKTQTAFNLAFNTELSFFEFLASDAEFRKRSAGLMKFGASLPGAALHHLVEAFRWSELGKALVVDVGGNSGHASVALAKAYPDLEFIVQDLPSAIDHALERAKDLEADIQKRVNFRAHDFFKEQPEKNADIYLVRRILHDWSDREARAILANIRDAMKAGSRMLIMDTVLPEPQSGSLTQEAIQRSSNLGMQQMFNSQERTLAEWEILLREVDAQFSIVDVTTPFESTLSLIEVKLA